MSWALVFRTEEHLMHSILYNANVAYPQYLLRPQLLTR
jgi:hypothetical protein